MRNALLILTVLGAAACRSTAYEHAIWMHGRDREDLRSDEEFATIHPGSPSEAITREQAVIAYTRGSAYAEFAENEKGTIAPGKLADLAVPVIGGRIIWER